MEHGNGNGNWEDRSEKMAKSRYLIEGTMKSRQRSLISLRGELQVGMESKWPSPTFVLFSYSQFIKFFPPKLKSDFLWSQICGGEFEPVALPMLGFIPIHFFFFQESRNNGATQKYIKRCGKRMGEYWMGTIDIEGKAGFIWPIFIRPSISLPFGCLFH